MKIGAFISGCAGFHLTPEEENFFKEVRPWGLILFRRNVDSPEQLRELTSAFRRVVERKNAPVFIDQEGGRVQRLGPPAAYWRKYPAAAKYGELYASEPVKALRAARLIARLMAEDLSQAGISVDCVPVLDVPQSGSHEIIGDRAYSLNPDVVSVLARATVTGMENGGVLAVIKHIPGHGRASADSHTTLPVVQASKEELERVDFLPFAALADSTMAMTAHVIYQALDRDLPATLSRKVVRMIRKRIGFDGLLITDDLSMNALSGDLGERTRMAKSAGCDMMLHCNGTMAEMIAVAEAAGELRGKALARSRTALKKLRKPRPFNRGAALKLLEEMLLVAGG